MMMFAMAAALLITGGALGTPWLTGVFGDANHVSSADEAGIVCPNTLVGLELVSDGEVNAIGDLFGLDCEYVLAPSTTVSADVSILWTEDGPAAVLERNCGLPPSITPGPFTIKGSYFGFVGQARADYTGQTRYSNAMQKLAANLVSAASTVSEPCPPEIVGANPGTIGETVDSGTSVPGGGVSGAGSQGQPTGQGQASPVSNGGTGEQPTGIGTATATLNAGGSQGGSNSEDSGNAVSPADVPSGSCLVRGRVTDSRGIAVPLVRVSLHDSSRSLVVSGATGETGSYSFGIPVEFGGRVVLTPTDGGRTEPVFRVFAEQAAVTLERDLSQVAAENGVCVVNFDIWNLDETYRAPDGDLDRWPSIIELYQNFNRAAELATQVGAPLDYGLPVPVYGWCSSSSLFCDPTGTAEFAFYAGTTTGRTVEQPYIALGFPSSDINYRGTPDNREYHEFGHAFMADVVNNEIAVNVGDRNHGGYFRNQKTTDSLIEGFSEFYSVMVSKHIDNEESAQRYKIGAEYDIEADRKPWEAVGWWEEFTLAGLLLDFEDGPEDYSGTSVDLDVESVSALTAVSGNFAIGRVRNLGSKVARSPEVTVNLIDGSGNSVFTQVTAVRPESLGPSQVGVFYVAAPESVEFSTVDATPGRPAGSDDDDINLELPDLLRAITSDWGVGGDRITTVEELYARLSDAFAGKDVDEDGSIDATQQQIDAIFIKHGFFDDIDGDRQWNPAIDGEIGGSAHPAATVGRNQFTAIMPRSSAIGFEGSFVDIDASGVDADLLVQVELADDSGSYAYWATSGTAKPVELAVPSASGGQASMTVIAVSEGHNPAVAYRTTAREFHAAIDSGEIQSEPVRASVEMEQGDPLALLGSPNDDSGSSSRAGGPPWTMLLPILLALLMLAAGFYIMRRTGNVGESAKKD